MTHPLEETAPVPSPAHADRLRFIEERKAQLEAAKKTREAAAALPPSPEDVLRAEEEQLKRMEVEEADEAAWQSALVKHGKGRVARVRTVAGDMVFRVQTGQEVDAAGDRITAAPDARSRALVTKEVYLGPLVHPAPARAREILELWPGRWEDVFNTVQALNAGRVAELEGKA